MKKNALDALKAFQNIEVSEDYEPELYARIKFNEGLCYYTISKVRDKEDNLNKAIIAFEEALKIYTIEKYPLDYAMTQNNLGIAYSDFSEVRDKEDNLNKAIRAYKGI